MHMHNNLQLAYANTIEGIIEGANFSTRRWPAWAAGRAIVRWNCSSASSTTRNTSSAPFSTGVQNHIEPMRAKLLWGYDLPYLLTGLRNLHPRAAIKFKEPS